MLYWIWFILLSLVGWFFAYRVWFEKGDDSGNDPNSLTPQQTHVKSKSDLFGSLLEDEYPLYKY